MESRAVVMGLLFYPRGGSAYVVRYLSPALERAGWATSLAVGSLGSAGNETSAVTFFAGLDMTALDYSEAAETFAAGGNPFTARSPMQPSYEDRAGVPDAVLASVDPVLLEHLSSAWEPVLASAGAERATVAHLHHLTPQLDAIHRRWPGLPLVVHLHGTELKLIEAIAERIAIAALLGETLMTMPSTPPASLADGTSLTPEQRRMLHDTRWDHWRHGEFWSEHLRTQAAIADHVITVSPQNRAAAIEVLDLEPEHVTAIPNGVDVQHFHPEAHTAASRRAMFRRVLVTDPQGWTSEGAPGSIAYEESDLDELLGPEGDATVLIYVGRFLAFKRVPALIRAFAAARSDFTQPASLLIWGGHPGEWEGEHPAGVAAAVDAEGIYFAGWRGHVDLPLGLAACDVLVVPSVDDPFPQVPLEAMAVGLPVLACASGGLLSMVNLDPRRPTGWLVPPDDAAALEDAIVAIVNHPEEVAERGAAALAHATSELSWDGRVPAFEAVYASAIARHPARPRPGSERPAA
ncbi:MAG TPA: glycosyltransferase family 4 protein [Acidimicrobiales bacterium]